MPRELRVAGFFAGIGGLELGLQQSSGRHRPIWFCEKDPVAREVLARRFRGVAIEEDVNDVERLPEGTELLVAGFPCQDLSSVGPALGFRGGVKSRLVEKVFGLLGREPRVPWILFENVPFMLRLQRGQAMDFLVRNLEDRGYRWAYRVVDARAFGLPQRRERVFLVASNPDLPRGGDPRTVLFADEHGVSAPERIYPTNWSVAHGFYWTEGTRGVGWTIDGIPTLKGGSALGIPSAPAIVMPDGCIVTPDIRDGERLQGFPANWTRTTPTHERARWRMVGNAVPVAAARWIGERIGSPGGAVQPLPESELADGGAWPCAAHGEKVGRRRVRSEVSASSWPLARERQPLTEFLEHPGTPLSYRATRGFRERYENGTLRKDEEFIQRLRDHEWAQSGLLTAPVRAGAARVG